MGALAWASFTCATPWIGALVARLFLSVLAIGLGGCVLAWRASVRGIVVEGPVLSHVFVNDPGHTLGTPVEGVVVLMTKVTEGEDPQAVCLERLFKLAQSHPEVLSVSDAGGNFYHRSQRYPEVGFGVAFPTPTPVICAYHPDLEVFSYRITPDDWKSRNVNGNKWMIVRIPRRRHSTSETLE